MRYRLLTPVGVAGAIALGAWIPNVTSAAAATPSLAPLSPQAVVAKALAANIKGFSGTVRWTANLGLPDVSGLTGNIGGQGGSNAFDPTSLLSGSHDISVWDAGPAEQRLALPSSLSEVDVVHNGADLYYFDSATDHVTHYTGLGHAGRRAPSRATGAELTPDQAAQKLLSGLGSSTTVTAAAPVYVAGQASYQVTLAPKAATSTVGAVTIAVDAANGMPLRVQVLPRGSATPALSLGFTSISFSVPSASNFAAPHGTSTTTKPIGQALDTPSGGGPHWRHGPHGRHGFGHWAKGPGGQLVPAPAPKVPATARPATAPAATAAPATAATPTAKPATAAPATPPAAGAPGGGFAPAMPAPRGGHPTTVGTGWTTIVVLNGVSGSTAGELGKVGTPVTGSFGSGRLVTSSLLNALLLPDGKVLVGFVTPSALEAAAGSAG